MDYRRLDATTLHLQSGVSMLATNALVTACSLVIAAAVMLSLVARPVTAQLSVKPNTARVTVVSIGHVVSHTGIVAGNRDNGGNLFASTTVVTTNNGPYALQAKLTVPFTDKGKSSIVNTVEAISPPGTAYVVLSTTTWVTVAIGAGGANKTNNVSLYVDWGKSSSKDPKQIPDIELTYQVIPH
ncbi:MAG TPA: hypothetical protein VGL65_11075 [Gemmatimonadales bacterium]|jgi:hypothetical protein